MKCLVAETNGTIILTSSIVADVIASTSTIPSTNATITDSLKIKARNFQVASNVMLTLMTNSTIKN